MEGIQFSMQVVSKKRVADYGEVYYTRKLEVNAMFNLMKKV